MKQLSRPQAVKHIWVYIKEKDLQNPADKREIICDDKMKKIFNVDKIGMFRMNQMLGECVFTVVRLVISTDNDAGTSRNQRRPRPRPRRHSACHGTATRPAAVVPPSTRYATALTVPIYFQVIARVVLTAV